MGETADLKRFWGMSILLSLSVAGCGLKDASTPARTDSCAPSQLLPIAGSSGKGRIFLTDPISSSGKNNLLPNAANLDPYTTQVDLAHLSGQGVLDGSLVSIRNRLQCGDSFGAFDLRNQFIYPHQDYRFQEAMSYYYGDLYQERLQKNGYLASRDPVVILAHCETADNSYLTKAHDISGQIYQGRIFNQVCLGDSKSTPGAYYADDAQVVIHELQHAATLDNYSPTQYLNQFFYDEAGGLNEGISDFMSLAFSDSLLGPKENLDLKLFSRWALGTFKPNQSGVRGAHRCPMYDSSFPHCNAFPSFSIPTNGTGSGLSVSYVYPDGLGWPFPNNFKSQNIVSSIYQSYVQNEEIHNNDLIVTGALWDVYSALKTNRKGDALAAFNVTQKLVLEAVRHLPVPNLQKRSPVTFIEFAARIVDSMPLFPELNSEDRSAIAQALRDRGLYQMPLIQSESWASVGPGTLKFLPNTLSPGVFIQDNPQILSRWLNQMGADSSIVSQGLSSGLNGLLDPGEVVVIWFDLQNNEDLTAGGVLLTVSTNDSDITILDDAYNIGYSSDGGRTQAQVMYAKVNGKNISSLMSSVTRQPGNTYFTTNPLFGFSFRTGIWVKVNPNAAHGKVVEFQVQAVPANSSDSVQKNPGTLTFPVTIQ